MSLAFVLFLLISMQEDVPKLGQQRSCQSVMKMLCHFNGVGA